jgi:Cu2+-containing amine oxidase
MTYSSFSLKSLGLALLAVACLTPSPCHADGTVTQSFPAGERETQTRWRVQWAVERHNGMGSEVLVIKSAHFRRTAGEAEVKVLGDCRLAEVFVPYTSPQWFYAVAGQRGSLADLSRDHLGPDGIRPGVLFDRRGREARTGPVASEVRDDHLRWMNRAGRGRRGQALHLWSVLEVGNARYVILYVFRDDGQVGFRLGVTGQNLYHSPEDSTTHVVTGCWRLNVDLDDQAATKVSKVTFNSRLAKTEVCPLACEARIKWDPEQFTLLRIESTRFKNRHDPASFIGYELLTLTTGSARYFSEREKWTLHDFWVTRAKPLGEESTYHELNCYENGESLAGGKPVLWHQASILHQVRDEDFGREGYNADRGVVVTAWTGFDLKPRNLFASSPLYPAPDGWKPPRPGEVSVSK